jgi:hypothetical protein
MEKIKDQHILFKVMIEDSHREELQDVQADEHEKLCLFTYQADHDNKVTI